MTDINEILSKLNPKTAQAFQVASNIRTEFLPTPSLGINMAINGIGYGRFTVLYGNRGSGKTTMALQIAAEAQRQGKSVAWIDVEKNFSDEWARSMGVDTDKMLVNNKTISIAGMADSAKELIRVGVDVLVVDSISQLLPQSFFEDKKNGEEEVKGLAQTGQIGTFSKNMGQAINIMNSINQHTAIILISQVRKDIQAYGKSIFQGGMALEHAASTVIKLWRTPSEYIDAEVHVGDGLLLKRPVGCPVTWTVEKNRGPGMGMSNTYDLYTAGDYRGVDLPAEVITFGVESGVIKKGGAWYTINDEQFQGKPKAVTYLRENPDVMEELYKKVLYAYSDQSGDGSA